MAKLLLLFGFLVGCGSVIFSPRSTISKDSSLTLLTKKASLYSKLVPKHQDSSGFILTNKCDSLLFSSLLDAASPELNIDIEAAQDNLGAWHRRPTHDCGEAFNNSRSTISRDMMVGLFWSIWRNKRVDLAVSLMEQLKSNLYYLEGQGTAGELLMTPALLNTLALIIKELKGPEYTVELLLPAVFSKKDGFVAHLTTWHIHLRGEVLGKIPERDLDVIKYHVNRNPENPLFHAVYHKYTDGDQSKAISLLLDDKEWPTSSLPTTTEHCDEWPIQRNYKEKDWGPCAPEVEHTGVELVVLYNLVIRN